MLLANVTHCQRKKPKRWMTQKDTKSPQQPEA